MAQYAIHYFCTECSQVHPCGIKFEAENGPVDKASIGDLYAGQPIPSLIISMKNNYFQCPVTGQRVRQQNNDQIFAVAVRD